MKNWLKGGVGVLLMFALRMWAFYTFLQRKAATLDGRVLPQVCRFPRPAVQVDMVGSVVGFFGSSGAGAQEAMRKD